MTIEIVQSSLFYQLAAILIAAGITGFIALKLRQPLIVAFIIVGLLAGPDVTALVNKNDYTIETLAKLGIALLLFMVGLKLDIGLIKKLGPVALSTGIAQVTLTAISGCLISLAIGFDLTTAMLLGVALSFSSTIIVVKLLSDKRAIDSLYGKISLGILIVQDIVVILSMVLLTAAGTGDTPNINPADLIAVFGKIAIIVALTGVFIKFCATPLTHSLVKAPELMVIFAIGLAATMAAICHYFDLSKELGGLLAGVALASTPQHNLISARLSPLRDFLLLFFFVGLGAQIELDSLSTQLIPALFLSVFVLLGKPLIIMTIMGFMGYRKRTSFMAGISLGQISEFSLIFTALAFTAGFVDQQVVAMITLTALITIALSTYAILNTDALHDIAEKYIGLFEKQKPRYKEEQEKTLKNDFDIIVFGLGRYGTSIALEFQRSGAKVLGVDFDPQAIKLAEELGITTVYGDASDPELPPHLPLRKTHTVVFAFQHHITGPLIADLRLTLAKILREFGYNGHIVSTSHFKSEEQSLVHHGVDIVICPFEDAAVRGANQVLETIDKR